MWKWHESLLLLGGLGFWPAVRCRYMYNLLILYSCASGTGSIVYIHDIHVHVATGDIVGSRKYRKKKEEKGTQKYRYRYPTAHKKTSQD